MDSRLEKLHENLESAVEGVSADLKRSHFRRSGVSHLALELTSVHTSTRAANR